MPASGGRCRPQGSALLPAVGGGFEAVHREGRAGEGRGGEGWGGRCAFRAESSTSMFPSLKF